MFNFISAVASFKGGVSLNQHVLTPLIASQMFGVVFTYQDIMTGESLLRVVYIIGYTGQHSINGILLLHFRGYKG